jgi:hypothetical protein
VDWEIVIAGGDQPPSNIFGGPFEPGKARAEVGAYLWGTGARGHRLVRMKIALVAAPGPEPVRGARRAPGTSGEWPPRVNDRVRIEPGGRTGKVLQVRAGPDGGRAYVVVPDRVAPGRPGMVLPPRAGAAARVLRLEELAPLAP